MWIYIIVEIWHPCGWRDNKFEEAIIHQSSSTLGDEKVICHPSITCCGESAYRLLDSCYLQLPIPTISYWLRRTTEWTSHILLLPFSFPQFLPKHADQTVLVDLPLDILSFPLPTTLTSCWFLYSASQWSTIWRWTYHRVCGLCHFQNEKGPSQRCALDVLLVRWKGRRAVPLGVDQWILYLQSSSLNDSNSRSARSSRRTYQPWARQ